MAAGRKKTSHPWVTAAVICQGLLEEKDNVLSIIRMVDLFTIPRPADWDGKTNLHMPLQGMVSLRAGDVEGKRTVRVYGTSPKGKRKKLFEAPVEFLGGNSGVNMKLSILFQFRSEGTHWLDVYVEKWHATRIPVTIVFATAKSPESEPSGKVDTPAQ